MNGCSTMWLYLFIFFVVLVVFIFLVLGCSVHKNMEIYMSKEPKKIEIVGHRGFSGTFPENTKVSTVEALKAGCDCVEVDVRKTKDGKLILMHDSTVDRTTNQSGYVHDLTLEEINWNEKNISRWVPTLESIVEEIKKFNSRLNHSQKPRKLMVELKDPELYENIDEDIFNLLELHDAHEEVVISSMDTEYIRKMKVKNPRMKAGYIWETEENLGKDVEDVEVISVNFMAAISSPEIINRLHTQGKKIYVWTLDDPWLKYYFSRIKFVDGVITNYP